MIVEAGEKKSVSNLRSISRDSSAILHHSLELSTPKSGGRAWAKGGFAASFAIISFG